VNDRCDKREFETKGQQLDENVLPDNSSEPDEGSQEIPEVCLLPSYQMQHNPPQNATNRTSRQKALMCIILINCHVNCGKY